jgi:hypothetical protein
MSGIMSAIAGFGHGMLALSTSHDSEMSSKVIAGGAGTAYRRFTRTYIPQFEIRSGN